MPCWISFNFVVVVVIILIGSLAHECAGFNLHRRTIIESTQQGRPGNALHGVENNKTPKRYQGMDAASQSLVASLTSLINALASSFPFSGPTDNSPTTEKLQEVPVQPPPQSPRELLQRIQRDYTVKNYLWTGDIDLTAYDEQCLFTDPTLSFTGTAQFVKNMQNLGPLVNALVVGPIGECCRSDLLDIQLNELENYVQTQWNMVGELGALPWKPRINVMGQTKFWYQHQPTHGETTTSCVRVVFYEEKWQLPAFEALWQLVTPAGTIPNSLQQ